MVTDSKEFSLLDEAANAAELCRELRTSLARRKSLPGQEQVDLVVRIKQTLPQARELLSLLEKRDAAQPRRNTLVAAALRQDLDHELRSLAAQCAGAGLRIPGMNLGSKPSANVRRIAGIAIPEIEVPSLSEMTTRQKIALPASFLVLAVLVLRILWPAPGPTFMDAGTLGDVAALSKLWVDGDTAFGVVTDAWYLQSDAARERKLADLRARIIQMRPVSTLVLYQPNERNMAAVLGPDHHEQIPRVGP